MARVWVCGCGRSGGMGWAVVSSVSSTEVAEDGQRAGELEISFSILNILWKNKLRAAGGTTRQESGRLDTEG